MARSSLSEAAVCRPVSWAGILGAWSPGLGELQGCMPSLSHPIVPRRRGGRRNPKFAAKPCVYFSPLCLPR